MTGESEVHKHAITITLSHDHCASKLTNGWLLTSSESCDILWNRNDRTVFLESSTAAIHVSLLPLPVTMTVDVETSTEAVASLGSFIPTHWPHSIHMRMDSRRHPPPALHKVVQGTYQQEPCMGETEHFSVFPAVCVFAAT